METGSETAGQVMENIHDDSRIVENCMTVLTLSLKNCKGVFLMRKSLTLRQKLMPVHVGGGEDHKLDPLDCKLKGTGSIESLSQHAKIYKTFSDLFVKRSRIDLQSAD